MNKAAFLDRDGVINRKAAEGKYVISWHDMEILPGVGEGIRLLNHAGFRVIVVSNQRCVAKGLITETKLAGLHQRMSDAIALDCGKIDAIYYCPHDIQQRCRGRKPEPGMLLYAAREHNLDLTASWMIGDSGADVQAGRRAGCRTVLLALARARRNSADIIAGNLLDAAKRIIQL